MLRYMFPSTPKGAERYAGGMESDNIFFRTFEIIDNDFETAFNQVNTFLEANGYSAIEIKDFDDENGYSDEPISLSLSAYLPELILFIERDVTSYTQSKYLTYLLNQSNIKSDFQNIDNEQEAEQKIAKDIINSLLLADKFGLNVEEIILKEIQKIGK